ncbi:MAG: hypothetical protein HY072_07185 [Deltaproteobacteria bacterium]|nr:hypothetical protein [Deltaproteobacteria bacterium]
MHIIVFRYLGLPFAAKGFFWLCVGILLGKCFFWVVYKNIENKPFFVFIVGLLFIAWSSSMSWGYRHPILALAPMGLVLFDVLSFLKENWFKKTVLVITASFIFTCSNYLIIKNSFF